MVRDGRTDGQTDGWKKSHIQAGIPPKNPGKSIYASLGD